MKFYGLRQGLSGKESACNAGDTGDVGSVPGQEDPLAGAWQPIPVFLPGESHGQQSLAGYSSWSHKKSDTTEVIGIICTHVI